MCSTGGPSVLRVVYCFCHSLIVLIDGCSSVTPGSKYYKVSYVVAPARNLGTLREPKAGLSVGGCPRGWITDSAEY